MVRGLHRLPKKQKAAFLTEPSRSSAEMHMPLFFLLSFVFLWFWRVTGEMSLFESPLLFPPHPLTHISFSFCLEPLCWSDCVFIFKDLIFLKYLNYAVYFALIHHVEYLHRQNSSTKSYMSKCALRMSILKQENQFWCHGIYVVTVQLVNL